MDSQVLIGGNATEVSHTLGDKIASLFQSAADQFVSLADAAVDFAQTPECIYAAKVVGLGVAAALTVNLMFAVVMRLSIGRRMNMPDWPQPRPDWQK